MKARNHVALALRKRGGGTKVHKKSTKTERRNQKQALRKGEFT